MPQKAAYGRDAVSVRAPPPSGLPSSPLATYQQAQTPGPIPTSSAPSAASFEPGKKVTPPAASAAAMAPAQKRMDAPSSAKDLGRPSSAIGSGTVDMKKTMNAGVIDNWTCINFSILRPEELQRFCMDVIHACSGLGMTLNPTPVMQVRSANPSDMESSLRDLHRKATKLLMKQGPESHLQLLLIILPDDSRFYGSIKGVLNCDPKVVTLSCLPEHGCRPRTQILKDIAVRISMKFGGRNTSVEETSSHNHISLASEVPMIDLGANVAHFRQGEDSSSSTDVVVTSMDWHLISAQPDLHEILLNGGMIGDPINECQLSHSMLLEVDAIRKACIGYMRPITYLAVSEKETVTDQKYGDINEFDLWVVTATPAPNGPKKVNVCVFGLNIPMPAKPNATFLELVQSALQTQDIDLHDFYLQFLGRILEGDLLMNSIETFEESKIHICPRLRGGMRQSFPTLYEGLDVILQNQANDLFQHIFLTRRLVDPQARYKYATLLTTFSKYIIHCLLVCVCRDGHQSNKCYNGAFELSDILISDNGEMRISPKVTELNYSEEGASNDYLKIHHIISTKFYEASSLRHPLHVKFLLHSLLQAKEENRRNPNFITFLINHPCLLTYAEKHKLYLLIDQLIMKLSSDDLETLKKVLEETGYTGWEAPVLRVSDFDYTYMRGATVSDATLNVRMPLYGTQLHSGFHLCHNFLKHHRNAISLEEAEVAASYLNEYVLPVVVETLVVAFKPKSSVWDIIGIISNPNADRSIARWSPA